MRHKESGFTLIELMVVISIIGLLSSIIVSALLAAKAKANDAAIISEVGQLQTLMEENLQDYGSYTNVDPTTGFNSVFPCNHTPPYFSGNYASQALAICQEIVAANPNGGWNHVELYLGATSTSAYSIMAGLSTGTYYCSGSSERASETMSKAQFIADQGWYEPGCSSNP